MFSPNVSCVIHSAGGNTDVFGMPIERSRTQEMCAIISMNVKSEKTQSKAIFSSSRGSASEFEADTKILLKANTVASIDDDIHIYGNKFRIMSMFPRINMQGVLDHYEVTCSYWTGA